jgi:putative nucleotidyltransferase with HDIG domain
LHKLTLLQATNRLGTSLIKVLVMSESVLQAFSGLRQASGRDMGAFWKHSLTVALIARDLAQRLDNGQAESAYLAGLLHDVGRLALLAAAPEHCHALFGAMDDSALCDVEQQRLEITHTEAGAWLLGRWRLSSDIIDSVLYHHVDSAQLPEVQPLTRTLHLAHQLAALPTDEPGMVDSFVCEQDLTSAELNTIRQQAAAQVVQIARDLGIDISSADQPQSAAVPTLPDLPTMDAAQKQLAQELFDRSVLNEMAMTLIGLDSSREALNLLRQHACALLQLEDSVVMLTRDDQQKLVPASLHERHRAAAKLLLEVASQPALSECVTQRHVVFVRRDRLASLALFDIMDTPELVLVPLSTAGRCLGVLFAAVPADMHQHVKDQTGMLQTFGFYAGVALSRRRQAEKVRAAQLVISKQEQQIELKQMAMEVVPTIGVLQNCLVDIDNKLTRQESVSIELTRVGEEVKRVRNLVDEFSGASNAATLGPVDLCQTIKDMVQLMKDSQFVPGHIELRCQLAERAAVVHGSLEMIQQIVLILVKNSCDNMSDGGELVINGGMLVQRDGAMFTSFGVSDSGSGSTQAIQAQLYEPPNRRVGDKPGLSLGLVNQLVDKMRGHLKFKASTLGTRYDILLPCTKIMH